MPSAATPPTFPVPKDRDECIELMLRTPDRYRQAALRQHLGPENYDPTIYQIALANPFFRLTDQELARFIRAPGASHARQLLVARQVAARSTAPKHAVFCMPKSGSSFLKNALEHALEIPFVAITGVGIGGLNSHYGINGREQEIDEFALVQEILRLPGGFVTQVHTRYTTYLGHQLRFFGITPIVTQRNILDCIVSFDDMMIEWRKIGDWVGDAQYALPLDYPAMAPEDRYRLLARSYGVWLIAFYLSWKRGEAQGVVRPRMIRYEEDILKPARLVQRLAEDLQLDPSQTARLEAYVREPDPEKSRFNVGVAGRGRERIPDDVRAFLLDHARTFRGELDEDDFAFLIG